jgi:hypothetical protein
MATLKIGDKIYSTSYGSINGVLTIDRITKNFAFCGDTKFQIEYNLGIQIVPRTRWHSTSYNIETEELQKELKIQRARRFVEVSNLSKLTESQIFRIEQIIKE